MSVVRASLKGLQAPSPIPDVPDTPAIGTATDVGTSRAFNNCAATVTFTSSTGGTPTSYTVTSSPGGFSANGSSPVTVTGLQSNTAYTFTTTATGSGYTTLPSTASNSITATSIPATISTPTSSDVGTGRPFNNGRADVSFTAPQNGGKTITGYTVTSSPGSLTGTGASSPITVTGLQSATAYTYTITATNANGTSTASSASASVTATTVPQVPGTPTASITNITTASLSFTPGATGGSAITSYTVTSSPSISLSVSGTSSPLTVTGSFAAGQAYTFTIAAVNANGSSTTSSSSNSIIPNQTNFFEVFNIVTPWNFNSVVGNGSIVYATGSNIDGSSLGTSFGLGVNGQINWQRTFASPVGSNGQKGNVALLNSSGNGYILGSYYKNGTVGRQTIITQYNSSGSEQFSYTYARSASSESFNSAVINASNEIFAVGDANNGSGLIYKFDGSGNLQWGKNLTAVSSGGSGLTLSHSNYQCGVSSSNILNVVFPYTPTGAPSPDGLILARFDTNGNITTSFSNASQTNRSLRTTITKGNNIYIASSLSNSGNIIKASESNGALTEAWNLTTDTTPNSLNGIAVDSSDSVYMLMSGTTGSPNFYPAYYLYKLNSSGTLQWARRIQSNSAIGSSTSYSLYLDEASSKLILAGQYNSRAFIARLPMDGTGTGTYTVGAISIIYENWASATVTSNTVRSWGTVTVTASAITPTRENSGATFATSSYTSDRTSF